MTYTISIQSACILRRCGAVTLASVALAHGLAFAQVTDISTVPLSSSSTALVKPNILFVLDDSGSMSWTHMPDALYATSGSGWSGLIDKVGYRNYLCNKIYYNPNATYLPPRKADGSSYPNASFTAALYDPYVSPTGTTTDLSSKFKAFDDATCWDGDKCSEHYTESAQPAYYYMWKGSGNPVDALFSNVLTGECAKPISTPGSNWQRVAVSNTSGPGGTNELTNFANWYSYYRTRIMMMKGASSRAFVQLGSQYRVGFITINPGSTVSADAVSRGRGFRFDSEIKLVQQTVQPRPGWWHSAAGSPFACRAVLRGISERHQQRNERRSRSVFLPAELHDPYHGRLLEREWRRAARRDERHRELRRQPR